MKECYKYGAYYIQLEDDEEVEKSGVALGNKVIIPGQYISKIGSKKRSSFEMQKGFYLKYVGKIENILLFVTNEDKVDYAPGLIYYAFIHSGTNRLLIKTSKVSCRDIRVDKLECYDIVPIFQRGQVRFSI